MSLRAFWFVVIAVLWTGFFVLEGFDFGVGMLHNTVGKTEDEKWLAVGAIDPVWDGNEVWLIVAGAGTFAAFPGWYATMFSGFYLALVLVLAGLILRGVSIVYRGRRESERWRRNWDIAMVVGSLAVPLLVGVALGNLLRGVPIASNQEYTGGFVNLLNPYSSFVGLTFLLLCALHGAAFLALKTDGPVRERSNALARTLGPVVAVVLVVFAAWTQAETDRSVVLLLVPGVAVFAIALGFWFIRRGREGRAFAATAVGMAATVATIFAELFPRVMVSSTSPANSLTIDNASSSSYSLTVMTVVAAIFFPLVLIYQGWTYHVFRHRMRPAEGRSGDVLTAAEKQPSAGDAGPTMGD